DEAAELQATMDRCYGGGQYWIHTRLAKWSRVMASWLSGERRSADLAPLAQVVEDAIGNGYWLWGRLMVADLAECAVYAGDEVLAKRAAALLLADPAPPAGAPHEGLRAFFRWAA